MADDTLCTVGIQNGVIWAAAVHPSAKDPLPMQRGQNGAIAQIHRDAMKVPDSEVRTMTVAEVRAAKWGEPIVPGKPRRQKAKQGTLV